MPELTVFKFIQNLWCYWEWKKESCQWLFLNEYINDNFFQLWLKWQFYDFGEFDWVYDNINPLYTRGYWCPRTSILEF